MTDNINKGFFFILLSLIWTNCVSQTINPHLIAVNVISKTNGKSPGNNFSLNINGDWKCVKHDYRGLDKFTFEQAEEIRKSILHIENQAYYFKNISFIEKCTFYEWSIKPFNAYDVVQTLELTYTKKQLKEIFLLDPVDKNGNTTCYDECIIFKKGDKLITDCGGDIFYWIKIKHK